MYRYIENISVETDFKPISTTTQKFKNINEKEIIREKFESLPPADLLKILKELK